MAPNRKKKKATKVASNPARGFATTSTPSKVEKNIEADISDSETPITGCVPTVHKAEVSQPIEENSQSNGADFLSPEDFEKQLEESELQALVEKFAPKSKKDSSRHVSRLLTDRRILRSQADVLNPRRWLPPEIMEQILDLAKGEMSHGVFYPGTDSKKTPKISEEDTSVRLWTLKQALLALDIPEERVTSVLRKVVEDPSIATRESNRGSRDSLWALEESFDWLALECGREELPGYGTSIGRAGSSLRASNNRLELDTPNTTPSDSGNVTPNYADAKQKEYGSTDGTSRQAPIPAPEQDNITISDLDSDPEPEQLLSSYVSAKVRLYELHPDSIRGDCTGARKSKIASTHAAKDADTGAVVSKLQSKLIKIESDILFDKYEADRRWLTRRHELFDKIAARKTLGLDSRPFEEYGDIVQRHASVSDQNVSTNQSDGSDVEDSDLMLAGLFATLTDRETDSATEAAGPTIDCPEVTSVTIRDFGKWVGMSPTRVLEEACRARDSKVQIIYRIVSSSLFSYRYSIHIQWSKDQNSPTSSPFSSLLCISSPRHVALEMAKISTPDRAQSEAYISTAALFLIFAFSAEEKVYLRLPPVWRDVWNEFTSAKKEMVDALDRAALRELRDIVREKMDRDEEDGVVLTSGFKKRNSPVIGKEVINDNTHRSGVQNSIDEEHLKEIWAQKSSSLPYQNMITSRKLLPMWGFKDKVLATIDCHQIVIICGETGCGKSTQVPSFILEHELSRGKPCKVYCTEPRRISAISLARRVSEELGEHKGELGTSKSLVGFAIRLESKTTSQTRIVYATTGIVMRMLERSTDLGDISHLILDEVHERSIESDFLLIVLRKLIIRRPELKVVLMSATVDAQRFSTYLGGAPVLNVPGRTFPVQTRFLEDAIEVTQFSIDDYKQLATRLIDLDDADADDRLEIKSRPSTVDDLSSYSAKTRHTLSQIDEYRVQYGLIIKLLEAIATRPQYTQYSKAILIFLPGIAEIRQLNDHLGSHPTFNQGWEIYSLHSTIASDEQEKAFMIPPLGARKIVLATNIAETGITIPDITCVIDTGKHKEMRLIETYISRANAKQRRGRAGRVQEGLCFHLFTKLRHDTLMSEQQTPEILRLSLQDLVLRVKICNLGGIEQTLSEALDAPSVKNIKRAIDALVDVKALTTGEDLTPLGRQLAKLPLDVFLGKLILLGCIFKCLDAALTIAAIVSSKSPFSTPTGARKQADTARLAFGRGDSDLLTVYNAFLSWRRVCCTTGASEFQFCKKHYLSQQSLSNIEDLRAQLCVSLVDAGFLILTEGEKSSLDKARFSSRQRHFFNVPGWIDSNSGNDMIVNSVIAWSFYPKLLARDGKGWRNIANSQSVSLHPNSINKGRPALKWLSFYHIMQSSNKFYNAHETSSVEDFAIALLCGDADFRMYSGVVIIDGNRARFALPDWKSLLAIKILRARLLDILSRSFRDPGKSLSAQQHKWLDIWQRIFSLHLDTKQ